LEGRVLGSFELSCKINGFKDYKEILNFVEENVPVVVNKKIKKSYLKRFFYTQAGFYKDMKSYSSQRFLYNLTHLITRGGISG
jgi:regulator of sirC expression with transglutaminase-like and TPR domain